MAKFNSNVYFGYKIKKPLEVIEPTWAPVGRLVWPSRCNVNKHELVRTWQNFIATFKGFWAYTAGCEMVSGSGFSPKNRYANICEAQ